MTVDVPRYAQIFNTLTKRMQAGQYPVDMRLPTESELCDEFSASRFTVREALRRLVEQGMVQRRQGAGSVVVSTTPQARYVHSLSSLSDLFQFALDTHYDMLSTSQVTLDARVAERRRRCCRRALAPGGGPAEPREGRQGHLLRPFLYRPTRQGYVRDLKRCVGPFYAHLANQTGEDILEVRQDIFGTRDELEDRQPSEVQNRHDRHVRVPPLHHVERNLDRQLQLARGRAVSLSHEDVARDLKTVPHGMKIAAPDLSVSRTISVDASVSVGFVR